MAFADITNTIAAIDAGKATIADLDKLVELREQEERKFKSDMDAFMSKLKWVK